MANPDPWPWYIGGPLIGLVVPALLILGGKTFGVSANLRHLCSAMLPAKPQFLRYDWWRQGAWNLFFAAGIVAGGWFAGRGSSSAPLEVAAATRADLAALGLGTPTGLVPPELFDAARLATPESLAVLGLGGVLVGFGARYAGGCTSGHAISGLGALQLPSLIAVFGFFAGGLASTYWLLPWVLR